MKTHLDRLGKKYGFTDVSGANYRTLMQEIIANNTESVSRAIGRLSKLHWDKSLSRLGSKKKNFILPNVEDVLPKRSVFIRKSAIKGDLITDTLKDKLTTDLRSVLNDFRTAGGEPAFLRRRGTMAGTINPKLIAQFQEKISETFSNYTKRDPNLGVPSNVKTIAVTETRSAINEIKELYNIELIKKNPNIKMFKKWVQNKSLAKKPRIGHSMVNGKEIPFEEKFVVPLEIKGKIVDYTPMDRPHDNSAPLEQIIGCNCDILYYANIDKR